MGTGLFARPLDTSQLRNKLGVCARDTHTHTHTGGWRPSVEYLHFLSQGGGKGCQSWATPSVPFPPLPGLGSERQTTGRGSCQFTRRLPECQALCSISAASWSGLCCVTHFVDEKPEARAKEAMVFLKCVAGQLQWVGLGGCRRAQGRHPGPRTGSRVRQDQLSTVATSARPWEPRPFPATCWASFCSPRRRDVEHETHLPEMKEPT